MSIYISLYKVAEDPKCLTKSLVNAGAGSNRISRTRWYGKLGNDYMNPTFRIKANSTTRIMDTANYIMLTMQGSGSNAITTNRYYLVEDIKVEPNQMYSFKCRLDPLMTYNAELKALNCTLDRSETIFNGYLPDSEFKSLGYRAIACVAFPAALNQDSFILMTTG